MTDISVVIPVGPNPAYLEWLPECIESVLAQTHLPKEIIIVDDGANLQDTIANYFNYELSPAGWRGGGAYARSSYVDMPDVLYYKTVWNVGVADAFNFGVGLSTSNLVFMLGSDDKMMPTCLEEVVKEYEKQGIEGWYNVSSILSSGDIITVQNNNAAVTKGFFKELGGFPPSAGVGACDALLLSIIMVHYPDRIIKVKEGIPLVFSREHEHQDTRKNMAYFAMSGVVEAIRNLETQRWEPKNE